MSNFSMAHPNLRLALGLLVWTGILVLEVMLMAIARFFERTSEQPTRYRLYVLPILLTSIGGLRYLLRIGRSAPAPGTRQWPDFTGDPWANIVLCTAGLLLIALGNYLYERMMGGGHE